MRIDYILLDSPKKCFNTNLLTIDVVFDFLAIVEFPCGEFHCVHAICVALLESMNSFVYIQYIKFDYIFFYQLKFVYQAKERREKKLKRKFNHK